MVAKSVALYILVAFLFFGAVAMVLHLGAGIGPAAPHAAGEGSSLESVYESLRSPTSLLLLQIIVVVAASTFCGMVFTRIGQPAVIGEMAAGIALGPTLFGAVWPAGFSFVYGGDKAALANLGMLSQIGILLFMFFVGMELDTRLLRRQAHSAVLISHTSIVFPFTLGLASALWLYQGYAGEDTPFLAFALFMGISMSITAFPVLARIIQERGLVGTALGNTALTCAAVDDVTAWTALAFIVALSKAQSLAGSALTVILTLLYVGAMILGARPLLHRYLHRVQVQGEPGKGEVVVVLVTVLVSAFMTEAIGIHALFGAFLAGVVVPDLPVFRRFLRERIEFFSTVFLLPIFFAFTGLRTEVGLIQGATDWIVCGALLLLAIVGKFGGSTLAARATGMTWRDSMGIGALMNTRGLMEMIALNIGFDLGVLSPKVFAMLVLMALLTTFSTGPILHALKLGRPNETALDARSSATRASP